MSYFKQVFRPRPCVECGSRIPSEEIHSPNTRYHRSCLRIVLRRRSHANWLRIRAIRGISPRPPRKPKPPKVPFTPLTDEEWWASENYKRIRAKTLGK